TKPHTNQQRLACDVLTEKIRKITHTTQTHNPKTIHSCGGCSRPLYSSHTTPHTTNHTPTLQTKPSVRVSYASTWTNPHNVNCCPRHPTVHQCLNPDLILPVFMCLKNSC